MELREISLYEARMNDLPASEPGEGEVSIWYALEDNDEYKGFMEVIHNEAEAMDEIDYFIVPDIYQGNGYGSLMLELFLDKYLHESDPDSMLNAAFSYSGDHGEKLARIFSEHGFEINFTTYRECYLPFETVYEKLYSKKLSSYKGVMMNLAEGMEIAAAGVVNLEDASITLSDLRDADCELSVLVADNDGKLEGLLLASKASDRYEEIVTDLYIAKDDASAIRTLLAFAVENARNSSEPPSFISFTAANERLEKVMDTVFNNPKTSITAVAEAEFNLGKYVTQLEISNALRR